MRAPSGDQNGETHERFSCVICVGAVDARDFVNIWRIPSTSATYAMRSPLGDQLGKIWISCSVANGTISGGPSGVRGQKAAIASPANRPAAQTARSARGALPGFGVPAAGPADTD